MVDQARRRRLRAWEVHGDGNGCEHEHGWRIERGRHRGVVDGLARVEGGGSMFDHGFSLAREDGGRSEPVIERRGTALGGMSKGEGWLGIGLLIRHRRRPRWWREDWRRPDGHGRPVVERPPVRGRGTRGGVIGSKVAGAWVGSGLRGDRRRDFAERRRDRRWSRRRRTHREGHGTRGLGHSDRRAWRPTGDGEGGGSPLSGGDGHGEGRP